MKIVPAMAQSGPRNPQNLLQGQSNHHASFTSGQFEAVVLKATAPGKENWDEMVRDQFGDLIR